MFKRMHYEILAVGIGRIPDDEARIITESWVLKILREDNPGFDSARFLEIVNKVANGKSFSRSKSGSGVARSTSPYRYGWNKENKCWDVWLGKECIAGPFVSSHAAAQWIYDELDTVVANGTS